MSQDNRMPALKDTLGRVATLATILNPDGISLRVLNYDKDENGDFDHLVTEKSITERLERVQCGGDTKLGTILEKKIITPMILDKARNVILKKPVIVVIITDGEVTFLLLPPVPSGLEVVMLTYVSYIIAFR